MDTHWRPNDTNYVVRTAPTNNCKGKPLITVRNAGDGNDIYSAPVDRAFVVAFSPDGNQLPGRPREEAERLRIINEGIEAASTELDAARRRLNDHLAEHKCT